MITRDFYERTLPPSMPRTIAQAGAMLRAGDITSLALTQACFAQIDEHDSKLHAFVALDRSRAIEAARLADDAFARGEDCGAMQGIPVAVKDIIDIEGIQTLAQSEQLIDSPVAMADAEVVARLRAAGAVVLGKTTTHEFAFSVPEDNIIGPAAHNPWKPGHFSGGSSSGSGVAVAAGMAFGALGTDTGGSVRSPSALCGITGFKPMRSMISRSGIVPLSPSLDTVGVLCRDIGDCHRMTRAIAISPTTCSSLDAEPFEGKRIGVIRHFFESDTQASDETIAALNDSLEMFRQAGCVVDDVQLSPLSDWNRTGMTVILSEALAFHRKWFDRAPQKYGPAFRNALNHATTITPESYLQAKNDTRRLTREAEHALEQYDFLVTTIQRGPAPLISDVDPWGFVHSLSYGIVFNVCDLPTVSVPTGWSASGLPLAMQIASSKHDVASLMALCALHEKNQLQSFNQLSAK